MKFKQIIESFKKKNYSFTTHNPVQYEGKEIKLSKEGKFYKFFVLNDRYRMRGGISDGAKLQRKKGYEVIFNFHFPMKIFAILYDRTRYDAVKQYTFYELTTGRMVLKESSLETAEMYFTMGKKEEKMAIDKNFKMWLKERFEENEKYFGVKGSVN